MIQLPPNSLDKGYVDTSKQVLILHFKNSADEYFTYRHFLDKAFTLDQHLETLGRLDTSNMQAYRVNDDLTTVFVEPGNQDWKPAALPGDSMVSFAQYKAMRQPLASEGAAGNA